MGRVDYFLDDDDIKDAQSQGQFLFIIPGDAAVKGRVDDPLDDKAKATWLQELEIADSKMYEDVAKDKDGNSYDAVCIEVEFQVPSDAIRPKTGEADPNAGRAHREWYRLVPAARKNKQHPKFKANNYALGMVLGTLRSIWGTEVVPRGSSPNLGEFFSGDDPPVRGKNVLVNVKRSRYEGKAKDELTDFVPLEMRGA